MESGYFAADQLTFPTLHTWSLAIEEQFYALYALALSVLAHRWSSGASKSALSIVAIGSGIGTIAVVEALRVHLAQAPFFLLPFRAWEFMVGIITHYCVLGTVFKVHRFLAETMALFGLGLIVLAGLQLHHNTPYPGILTLAPTIGCALVLYATSVGSCTTRSALSSIALVWLGRLSYSLYLWHWPVLSFAFLVRGNRSGLAGTSLLLVLSLLLSGLSYFLVESPVRSRRLLASNASLLTCVGLVTLGLGLLGNFAYAHNGVPSRFSLNEQRLLSTAQHGPERLLQSSGPKEVRSDNVVQLGLRGIKPSVLVWGDSHARALLPAVDQALLETGESGLAVFHPASPPLTGVPFNPVSPSSLDSEAHRAWGAAVIELVRKRQISEVILVARWTYYPRAIKPGISDLRTKLPKACDLIIVEDIPFPGDEVPRKFAAWTRLGLGVDAIALPEAEYTNRLREISEASTIPGVTYLTVKEKFYSKGTYQTLDQDGLFYVDGDHLSAYGASRLTSVFVNHFVTFR